MKKILSTLLLTAMLISALCLTAFAVSDADFVGENEFVIASFNGINTFVKSDDKAADFEDATFWLVDQKTRYNIKYVSFIGQIANTCSYSYANYMVAQGKSADELTSASMSDPVWNEPYKKLASAASIFKDEGIPMGVSTTQSNYVSSGYNRNNLIPEWLPVEGIMHEEAEFDFYDDNNYYTVIENNGRKYLVFQLELWPRQGVLDWFNNMMAEHPDKYVIICTTSFIDGAGAMYTMWDWANGFTSMGTTSIKSCNMTWSDKPRDGQGIWDYAFGKYDTILAVISSNTTNGTITATKFKNANGVEVAAVAANADIVVNASKGPTVLLTKISADNTEITFAWSTAFKGLDESSIKTIKLDKIGTPSEPTVDDSLPQIPTQYNGANKAYIFGYEGNTFRPNANMTRAEACTIFARLILGVQQIPDGYVTRFTDVKEGDWFYNAIAFLDQTGYFFRNKNTTYKPNEPITRAEFVELANSASSLVAKNEVSFNDVSTDHFYYNSIVAAAASGLVNGYEDGTFRPDKTITRAEVVTVINRLLGLKVTDKTVSLSHLDNEFVDIGTHWGKLNILMASNSDVHGDYYYEASLDGVKESATAYTFANKHFSFDVNKKNGKVSKITNLLTGEDVTQNTSSPQFIYLMNSKDSKIVPTKLETEGNRIKVTFKGGIVVYMIVDIHDNFMTFEIDSQLPAGAKRVTFANLLTNLGTAKTEDDYQLNAIGMTAWTNPVNKGYRKNASSSIAHAYSIYDAGTMGAKLGIVMSRDADSLEFLQEVMDNIDRSVGLASKAGGAYAHEWEKNYGDYALVTNIDPATIDENIKLAVELDIDQYDIHQGANTFRQGDFVFSFTENGTAKEYYENVGKKLEAAGIETALHTYAYYIAYSASNILSDPKWQKDLETLETYTLRKKITKFSRNLATEEDATAFDTTVSFFYKNSKYVMVDQEIIYVSQGTTSGFINVQRGQCGTEAAAHAAGSTIYHLSGYFTMFVPKLGSDLFYHVADLTAKAYNEGGFNMIYLDAIDGLNRHTPEGHETWYYFQMFVQRITSQCERDPNVETSSGAPSEWNVRGRCGAWDTCNRSIKKFIKEHVTANKTSMNNNMRTTLGWWSFFPDGSPVAGLKNTIEKTIFHDDFDYLGLNALLYDMSIVFNPFSVKNIIENPYHYSNVKYYTDLYTKLRKSHYFTEETLKKVESIGGEWKVIEKNPGEYAFLQMYYAQANLGNAKDVVLNTYTGNNPFDAQMPFIRIESRYSTLFENPVVVAEFDETKTLGEQSLKKTMTGLDLTPNMAMSLKVLGTGKDGDAMLIKMVGGVTSGESGGHAAYFIDLNFTGWKEVIILDGDHADYDTAKYKFSGIGTAGMQYATFRTVANYKNLNNLEVLLCGDTAKNAQISTITAYTHTDAPIKNPTITVGSDSITFNCSMKGGEYLEYDPLTGKAVLYHNGLLPEDQTSEEVTFTGKLNVAKGNFTAKYTATAETAAPVRARITLGFQGQEIMNEKA